MDEKLIQNDDETNTVEDFKIKINKAKNNPIRFLLVGQAGTGKSSTVNRLIGKKVAIEGDFRPETESVEMYETEINGFKYQIFDTPGLCDDLPHIGNDGKYLKEMNDKIGQIDLLLYVTELSNNRVLRGEKQAIRSVTKIFSKKIWDHAVIVFTHSRNVDENKFEYWKQGRTEVLLEEIKMVSPKTDLKEEHFICIDNKDDLEGDNVGLSELWLQTFLRIRKNGALQFLLSQASRIDKKKPKRTKSKKNIKKAELKPSKVNEHYGNTVTNNLSSSRAFVNPDSKKIDKIESKVTHIEEKLVFSDKQFKVFEKHLNDNLFTGIATTLGAAIGNIAGPAGSAIGAAIGYGLKHLAKLFK